MKNGLLVFVLAVMVLPLVQHCLPFIKTGPLQGLYKDADDVVFSVPGWLDGSYQHQKELYLNDRSGFRPDLVRLNDQVDYSFFDKCHAGWDVKGKGQQLFQWPYIYAYYGKDFVGYDTVYEKARKLKAIQDTLARMGKSLIVVFAASKATSYPEYFPDRWVQDTIGMTNHKAYTRLADSLGINHIDMDTWFRSMKGNSKEPLFSKQGIHWTYYGAVLAGDSMMSYVERLRHIHITHPDWSEMEHTTELRSGDNDLATEINLIFPVATETLAYPIIKDVPDSTATKPNFIYIGDSFGSKLVRTGLVTRMNGTCEYWNYFNEVAGLNPHKYCLVRDYDWSAAIDKADCVVLIYTTINLKEIGNGFIEAAYDHYYPAKK